MNNQLSMSAAFERQKNIQASAITAAIAAILLFIFIWVKLTIPQEEKPPTDEVMEVNLGSGDQGMGTDQPLLPGDPAPAQQTSYTPPQPVQSREEAVKDVADDNEKSNEAPPVIKPAISKPDAPRINAESKTVTTKNTHPQPVITQAPPRPKAVLGRTIGGNGNGGNGADSYKPGGNEGIAGGNGDQGRPGGDPNGKNYTGAPRNFGVRVLSIPNQTFEDDFNQNAKIAMDIVVNDDGKVVSATYQPKGSTGTATDKMKDIARRRAFELKFPTAEGGQRGTVIFNFKVRG
ncbi:MAG: hypothetical protein ACXVMS_02010 [Flavisolibacter sp.]